MSETPKTAIEALASVIEYADFHGRLHYPGQPDQWYPGFEAARKWILSGTLELAGEGDSARLIRLRALASPAKEGTP